MVIFGFMALLAIGAALILSIATTPADTMSAKEAGELIVGMLLMLAAGYVLGRHK